jgi:hypothetical protein
MTITVKYGRQDGIPSSLNLFFENGLRLRSDSMTFQSRDENETTREKFREVVEALRAAGFTIKE